VIGPAGLCPNHRLVVLLAPPVPNGSAGSVFGALGVASCNLSINDRRILIRWRRVAFSMEPAIGWIVGLGGFVGSTAKGANQSPQHRKGNKDPDYRLPTHYVITFGALRPVWAAMRAICSAAAIIGPSASCASLCIWAGSVSTSSR